MGIKKKFEISISNSLKYISQLLHENIIEFSVIYNIIIIMMIHYILKFIIAYCTDIVRIIRLCRI
jgi:hypothetical protein